MKRSLPRTPEGWLLEIRLAIKDARETEPFGRTGPAHTFSLIEKTLRDQAENPRKALIFGVSTRLRSGRAANTGLPEQSSNHRNSLGFGLVRRMALPKSFDNNT